MGYNNVLMRASCSSKQSGSSAILELYHSYGPYENMAPIRIGELLWRKLPPVAENLYGRVIDVGKNMDDGTQVVLLQHADYDTDAEFDAAIDRLRQLDFQTL